MNPLAYLNPLRLLRRRTRGLTCLEQQVLRMSCAGHTLPACREVVAAGDRLVGLGLAERSGVPGCVLATVAGRVRVDRMVTASK